MGLSKTDSSFLANLRSLSIFMIVFGHVGLGWVFKPWSEFITVFVAIFFFISGAVSLHSFQRTGSIKAYYWKRLTSLLIPYYLLCAFSLGVYIVQHFSLPEFSLVKFIGWLQIRPPYNSMPFDIGQVWFVHTLVVISIASPVYFSLIIKNRIVGLMLLCGLFLGLSFVQLRCDIDNYFFVYGNNLYRALPHSLFFIAGAFYFSNREYLTKCNHLIVITICISICLALVVLFKLRIGYGYHTYAPDLYYVAGSFSAIHIFLLLKDKLISFVSKYALVNWTFKILFDYTMPIFLLHSFAIFFCENVFGLVHPSSHKIIYGLVKFVLVLLISIILSYPFSRFSSIIKRWLSGFSDRMN